MKKFEATFGKLINSVEHNFEKLRAELGSIYNTITEVSQKFALGAIKLFTEAPWNFAHSRAGRAVGLPSVMAGLVLPGVASEIQNSLDGNGQDDIALQSLAGRSHNAVNVYSATDQDLENWGFSRHTENVVSNADLRGVVANFGFSGEPEYVISVPESGNPVDTLNPYMKSEFEKSNPGSAKTVTTLVLYGKNTGSTDGLMHTNSWTADGSDILFPEARVLGIVETHDGKKWVMGADFNGDLGAFALGIDPQFLIAELVSQNGQFGVIDASGNFRGLFYDGGNDGSKQALRFADGSQVDVVFSQAGFSDTSNGGGVVVEATAGAPELANMRPEVMDILKNLGPTFTLEQLNDPEMIQFVDFDTLNSQEFAEAMVYAANHGMLPKHPDTAQPMQYVTLSDDKFDGGGVNNYFTPDLPGSQAKEAARAYAPYITFNTSINGVPVNLTIEGYLNNDKSIGLLGIVTSPYPGSSDQSDFLRKSLTIGEYGRVIAGTYFKDHDSCLKYYGKTYKLGPVSAEGLCKWAMSNQADQRFIRTFKRWSNPQDGVLSNTTGSGSGTQYYLPIISMGYKTVAK